MSKASQSPVQTLLGLAIISLLVLWFFDWSTWAWFGVVLLALLAFLGARVSSSKQGQGNEAQGAAIGEDQESRAPEVLRPRPPHSDISATDSRETVSAQGREVWSGSRSIKFAYQSFEGENTDREVTVYQIVSEDRGDSATYFQGLCHLRGEPRTFRVDRIKGKVIDTTTGEMQSFRQMFGL